MCALAKSLFGRIYPDLSYSENQSWNGIRDTIGNNLEFQDSGYLNNLARSTLDRMEAIIDAEGWYAILCAFLFFVSVRAVRYHRYLADV